MKKIREMYIKATTEHKRPDGSTYEMETVLDTYYKVPARLQEAGAEIVTKAYEASVKREDVEKHLAYDTIAISGECKLKDFKFVHITKKGRYKRGTYFAHEYDAYLPGKVRKITWSDGTVEYEVVCLDENVSTIAGLWDDELVSGVRIDSGTGDYFELDQGTL